MADSRTIDTAHRCLYCLSSSRTFRSVEHVFAESLGNTELVLPAGVACDPCNNGRLSVLDQVLCEFMPIKMMRTIRGIRSKSGTVPVTRHMTGSVANDGGSHVNFNVDRANDDFTFREVSRNGDEGRLQFNFKGGRKLTERYAAELSASLLKSALARIWLDHGVRAYDADLDHVRYAVLGEPRDGFFLLGRVGNPDHVGASLTYRLVDDPAGVRVPVAAEVFGAALSTDSRLVQPADDLQAGPSDILEFKARNSRRDRTAT